jgi:hypothetical protein
MPFTATYYPVTSISLPAGVYMLSAKAQARAYLETGDWPNSGQGRWYINCILADAGRDTFFDTGNWGDSGIYKRYDELLGTIHMQGVVHGFPAGVVVELSCSMVMNPGTSDIKLSISNGSISAVRVDTLIFS